MSKKPNIIIFNPDQFRADAMHHLGCDASVTPNFDATVQKDGVSFANALQIRSIGLLINITLPNWFEIILGLLLLDAWMYIWHRANHGIPFL